MHFAVHTLLHLTRTEQLTTIFTPASFLVKFFFEKSVKIHFAHGIITLNGNSHPNFHFFQKWNNFAFKLNLCLARAHFLFKAGVIVKRQQKPGSCSNIQYSLKLNFFYIFFTFGAKIICVNIIRHKLVSAVHMN